MIVNSIISLERIWGYTTIEQESKPSPEGIPPAYWPASGSLVVEKLSARYSQNGPKVLHDISFKISSGERVGVGAFPALLTIQPLLIVKPKLGELARERHVLFLYLHATVLTLLKSSLTLALLRCIFTEGDVFYDGIKTSDINLDALRSKITIIPQLVSECFV